MFRHVCTQSFLDAAHICNLLEVAVHPLIGRNRQYHTFFDALGMVLVFLCNHSWYIQQGDIAHIVCLFAWLPYPIVPVAVLCDMLRCQMLRIRERQATQRTKDKNITDSFKAWYIKLLIDDGIEFLFRQEVTVTLCLVKANFGERVIGRYLTAAF